MSKSPSIIVSDHALMRYLDRHHGLDVEKYRREVLDLVTAPIAVGASTFAIEGVCFAFKRNMGDGKVHVATTLTRRTHQHKNSLGGHL